MASTLGDVRKAIADTLAAELENVMVYPSNDDDIELPAIVVELSPKDSGDFNGAFQRGLEEWSFDLCILIDAQGGIASCTASLDEYVSGDGERSVRRILYENPTAGLDDVDINVDGVKNYGGSWPALVQRQISHVGAVVKLTVRIS